ncbi:glycosyltransferase [Sideroxydans lithotrophicus]|uniref:TPR domain-containing protein n=1 Tax=Sideroxydans lithotrophicus (strain ES-1) TaxID=580332 RepID=D5CN15_SIDLE|nr:glycosyltransferase [Sideroxydans lithotrophicus]ADE10851.1 TPR domain-containing protein [Sideroxydans lithotrophicus ES-1]
MQHKIRIVVATRESREDFLFKTALGKSLALYNYPQIEIALFDQNKLGLPAVYNMAIEAAKQDPAILVFVHDDVHLCGFNWPAEIVEGLDHFQLIGLAGNRRRVTYQPAWCFVDAKFTWDTQENLSGMVGHGTGFPPANIKQFGPPGREVKLLDGLFMACDSRTLLKHGLKFDERFDFHFYDMDFCREAEKLGIKMGTWSISTIHESLGNFGSEAWLAGYLKYLEKWEKPVNQR